MILAQRHKQVQRNTISSQKTQNNLKGTQNHHKETQNFHRDKNNTGTPNCYKHHLFQSRCASKKEGGGAFYMSVPIGFLSHHLLTFPEKYNEWLKPASTICLPLVPLIPHIGLFSSPVRPSEFRMVRDALAAQPSLSVRPDWGWKLHLCRRREGAEGRRARTGLSHDLWQTVSVISELNMQFH